MLGEAVAAPTAVPSLHEFELLHNLGEAIIDLFRIPELGNKL